MPNTLIIRRVGVEPYAPVLAAMQRFTDHRGEQTADEIWLLQHEPVFTQGQAGKAEHVLAPGDIPVVQVDRGGQVTYHGPGQLMVYLLLNLRRLKLGVREMVTLMESAVIEVLAARGIAAYAKPDAPGVYVEGAKIASLGLRVRRGCSFHGLALNVEMDLTPFQRINPCGYAGMQMTQIAELCDDHELSRVAEEMVEYLSKQLGYNRTINKQELDLSTDV